MLKMMTFKDVESVGIFMCDNGEDVAFLVVDDEEKPARRGEIVVCTTMLYSGIDDGDWAVVRVKNRYTLRKYVDHFPGDNHPDLGHFNAWNVPLAGCIAHVCYFARECDEKNLDRLLRRY